MSHSAENFRRGILYCCISFGYVWQGGGSIKIFYRFCLTVPKNRRGKVSDTGKVCRRRGEYQDFPSKTFCLTVPKFSVGESFTVAVFSGTGKVWIRGGGGVSRFPIEKFFSQSKILFCFTEKFGARFPIENHSFRRGTFIVALISDTGKVCRRRGEYQIFSKSFCLTVSKISVGLSFVVASFGYRKSL